MWSNKTANANFVGIGANMTSPAVQIKERAEARAPTRWLFWIALVTGYLALSATWSSATAQSAEQMAKCVHYYSLWDRYLQNNNYNHSGQKMRAELAMVDCRHGRYDEGLRDLEQLLTNDRFTVDYLSR
jgi:hypothetical protein